LDQAEDTRCLGDSGLMCLGASRLVILQKYAAGFNVEMVLGPKQCWPVVLHCATLRSVVLLR